MLTHRKRRERSRNAQAGFTLVELLLVLAIIAALAAVVLPKFTGRSKQARIAAAQAQISTFETCLDAFEIDCGYYPEGEDGLYELIEAPDDVEDWQGPYLKKDIPLDPWGNPYIYECPGKYNEEGYDIASYGPDGREGGDDDITNWD